MKRPNWIQKTIILLNFISFKCSFFCHFCGFSFIKLSEIFASFVCNYLRNVILGKRKKTLRVKWNRDVLFFSSSLFCRILSLRRRIPKSYLCFFYFYFLKINRGFVTKSRREKRLEKKDNIFEMSSLTWNFLCRIRIHQDFMEIHSMVKMARFQIT